jgi:hypothetical protein
LAVLVVPKEKIALNDFPRIIAAAFFGVAFNMLTFFGVEPYFPYLGIRDYGDPMIVLILSAIILKERMRMVAGILGLTGTAFLILYGRSVGSATNAV